MTLPSFVIAGERRGGSTALARWLESHPEVYLDPKVDTAFFVDGAVVGATTFFDGEIDESTWISEHSIQDYERLFESGIEMKAIGEKSADYLFWKPSHARLAEFLPNAKFLITLRNPVDRAWSHYWNEVGKGRESLSFENAIKAEESRCEASAYARDHLSYIARGKYDETLTSFFQHIEPANVHIVTLEELVSNPRDVLAPVYKFLGVNPDLHTPNVWKKVNANWTTVPYPWAHNSIFKHVDRLGVKLARKIASFLSSDSEKRKRRQHFLESLFRKPQSKIVMPKELRRKLNDGFSSHVNKLEQLLQRNFDCWRGE